MPVNEILIEAQFAKYTEELSAWNVYFGIAH